MKGRCWGLGLTASVLVVMAACGDATSSDDVPALPGEDASVAEGGQPQNDASSSPDAGSTPDEDAAPEASTPTDASDVQDASTDAADAADAAPPAPSVQVDFTAEPAKGFSGVVLGSISVRVRDAQGQLVTAPTSVTLSLASGPGSLGGTTVKDTSAGVATFTDLAVSKSGTYEIVATASGVTAQSASFTIDAWQPYSGTLTGGTPRRVVVDPTDPKIAYAASDSAGIFRTTDGATWAPIAFPGTSTLGLVVDPVTPTTIYAGQDDKGLYKSTDRGTTWSPANAGYTNKYVRALAIDETNPQILYWGTNTGLLKSTDGGTSWSPANDPAFATAQISAVAVAQFNGQTVYVQAYNQQVYRSANAGLTWTAMTGLPANAGVRSFAIHPADPNTVYASLGDSAGGVWKSTAGGAFTQIANAPVATGSVQDIAIVKAAPWTMYLAAYGSNVFKSVDGGVTWTNLQNNLLGGNVPLALAMASDASTLYVGHYLTSGGGITKSTNGGSTWTNISTGFVAFDVNGIAVDPGDSSKIFVGGGSTSLQRSADKGLTYTKLVNADGINWGGDFVVRYVGTTLYAGNNGGGIFKSTNGGTSFVRDTVLGNAKINALAPSPVDPNTVYAGGFGFGVTATSNGGGLWTTKTTPTIPWIYVAGVAAHPTTAGTAYAGISDGLYRTTDSGLTWNKVGTLATSMPYVAFDAAGKVYAASTTVQSSPDGNTWTDITAGGATTVPLTNGAATYLGVFPIGGSDVVFVGANGGLWRRAGGTWAPSFPWPTKILSMTQDPTTPTTLYVGTKGGGMYRSLSAGE